MREQKEPKRIFKKKLAYELRKRGCVIVGTEPNKYKPEFDVYLFENTDLLKRSLDELTK